LLLVRFALLRGRPYPPHDPGHHDALLVVHLLLTLDERGMDTQSLFCHDQTHPGVLAELASSTPSTAETLPTLGVQSPPEDSAGSVSGEAEGPQAATTMDTTMSMIMVGNIRFYVPFLPIVADTCR
jgi:hypothetical protein